MKAIPFNQVLPFVLIGLSAAWLSGCGDKNVKQETMSDAETCTRFQKIIADHPNQFKNHRKNMVLHKRYNSWTADKILPSARECQVWEWGQGLTNYSCQWKVENENEAMTNFQDANKVIQQCLGSSWKAETNTTKTGGQRTVFRQDNSSTQVSVRFFKESTGWPRNWYNAIIVGDKSNVNTPVQ